MEAAQRSKLLTSCIYIYINIYICTFDTYMHTFTYTYTHLHTPTHTRTHIYIHIHNYMPCRSVAAPKHAKAKRAVPCQPQNVPASNTPCRAELRTCQAETRCLVPNEIVPGRYLPCRARLKPAISAVPCRSHIDIYRLPPLPPTSQTRVTED